MKKWIARVGLACGVVVLLSLAAILLVRWLNPEPAHNGKLLSEWMLDLRSTNSQVRSTALSAVHAIGSNSVPYLSDQLTNNPSGIQKVVTNISARLPKPLAAPFRRIYNPEKEMVSKFSALQTLAILGPAASSAIPALAEVLREPNIGLCSLAAAALGAIGPPAIPVLVSALDDGDYNIRSHAAYALASMGTNAAPAVERLGRILAEERGPIVAVAVTSLARIGAPAVSILANLLTDKDVAVRAWSAHSLAVIAFSAKPAIPALLAAVKDPAPEVRQNACLALSSIDPANPEILDALLEAITDSNPQVRETATALFILRAPIVRRNLSRFETLLKDESAPVRAAAATAIGNTGTYGLSAVPALEELLNDPDEQVKLNAEEALKTIRKSIEVANARNS